MADVARRAMTEWLALGAALLASAAEPWGARLVGSGAARVPTQGIAMVRSRARDGLFESLLSHCDFRGLELACDERVPSDRE
jgi:hypothetical protein